MRALPDHGGPPLLRLSVRDLVMLHRACGGEAYDPPLLVVTSVRFIGPLRPNNTTCLLRYRRARGKRRSSGTPSELSQRMVLAAEAVDIIARAIGHSADELWNETFIDFLRRTLVELCSAQAANR